MFCLISLMLAFLSWDLNNLFFACQLLVSLSNQMTCYLPLDLHCGHHPCDIGQLLSGPFFCVLKCHFNALLLFFLIMKVNISI